MCADDRNTFSRGRCAVPDTLARTRTWRRLRGLSAFRYLIRIVAPLLLVFRHRHRRPGLGSGPPSLRFCLLRLTGLAGLAANARPRSGCPCPCRVRRTHPANASGFFADRLLVDTHDRRSWSWPSSANVMPSGGVKRTGCEYPTLRPASCHPWRRDSRRPGSPDSCGSRRSRRRPCC